MDSTAGSATVNILGVEICFPSDRAFTYTGETLTIDLSGASTGKLHIKPSQKPVISAEKLVLTAPKACKLGADPSLKVIPDSQAGQSTAEVSWFNDHLPSQNEATSEPLEGSGEGPVGSGPCERSIVPEASPAVSLENETTVPEGTPLEAAPGSTGKAAAGVECGEAEKDPKARVDTSILDSQPASNKHEEALEPLDNANCDKENTPAAANRPGSNTKRKSDGKLSFPSTGRRSGKKQKALLAQEALGISFQWRPVDSEASGEQIPGERWGATLTSTGVDQAWLFGGNSEDDQLGDIWEFSVGKDKWSKLSNSPDQTKAWHQAHMLSTDQGQHYYVIGGERVIVSQTPSGSDDEADLECLSEVCQYDRDSQQWMQLPISGTKLYRSGHSTTLLPDGRILSFGGIDRDSKYHNDAYIIDMHNLNCFSLSLGIIKGAPPKPRAYHSATLVGSNIVVLGGSGNNRCWSLKEVYSLSIETWHWKEHTADVEGEAPSPRSGHSAVALPGDRYLLVFGGGIPEQHTFFGTLSVLDTHTWTWNVPSILGVERPRARSGHAMAMIQTASGQHAIVLHGGRTHEQELRRDTWILERVS